MDSSPDVVGGTQTQANEPRLRLLIVSSDTYPATRVDVSVLFGEELATRGHVIDWILQSEHKCAKAYVARLGSGSVWVGPTDLGTSLLHRVRKHVLGIVHDLRLFALLRRGNYDIIEVKDKFLSGLFAIVAARLFRKRFVYWLSYPFPEAYLYGARDGTARYPTLWLIRGATFSFLLYRVLLRAADHVFVQSDQMQRDVAGRGVPLAKLTPVPMGVKLDNLPAGPRTENRVIPEGDRCFLYLGAIQPVRRIDFLIRVLAKVREQVSDAKLYLVGAGDDPSHEQSLVDEARRLNVLDAVVFTGQLPRDEAFEYVQEADVCVSPIFPNPVLNPASPTKLVEYMALGKAVVANDHPDQRMVLEQSGAGICVPWDEAAFASAIVKLMTSPQLATAMGERGRNWVASNRAYPIIADRVERAFLKVSAAATGDRHERP